MQTLTKSINEGNISQARENLIALKVEYNAVKPLTSPLTEKEIIDRVGGGDLTDGSCASLGFAYIGNKGQLDVLDYRDGESRNTFASIATIREIAGLEGVDGESIKEYNDFNAVNKLIKKIEEGKEYFLATGTHAAIIKKGKSGFEYLELQEPHDNGFKRLTTMALKDRFGCKKSHTILRERVRHTSCLIECESLSKSSEFKELLGYINTSKENQVKGEDGYAK